MLKRNFILFLGLWIVFLTLSGLPRSWKTVLFVSTGTLLVALSLMAYRRGAHPERVEQRTVETFKESRPVLKTETEIPEEVRQPLSPRAVKIKQNV